MGKRFREFFVQYAVLPGACGMLTVPAKRMRLPRLPAVGEDLIAFYDELERRSGAGNESPEPSASTSSTAVTECAPDVVKVSQKKKADEQIVEKTPAEDKENNQRNQMTGKDPDTTTGFHKQADDADEADKLTSSGFLITVLSDNE